MRIRVPIRHTIRSTTGLTFRAINVRSLFIFLFPQNQTLQSKRVVYVLYQAIEP